jgi:hypothetical protein
MLGRSVAPAPKGTSLSDHLSRWMGLESNPAGVIFGTITVGAVLAGENAKGESVRTSVEVAFLIVALFWLVHAWSDDTGERIADRRRLKWRPLAAALEHQASILRSLLVPVITVAVCGLVGASDATALWVGTITCAVSLVLIELLSALRNRLPLSQVLVETAAGAAFGCSLLVLHFLIV